MDVLYLFIYVILNCLYNWANFKLFQDVSRKVVMAAAFILKTVSGSEKHFLCFLVKKLNTQNY